MAAVLQLVDESPGSGQEPRPIFELRLVSERITARELIRRRVEREVEEYNQVESLDDELVLTERGVASFVQLLPLVGG